MNAEITKQYKNGNQEITITYTATMTIKTSKSPTGEEEYQVLDISKLTHNEIVEAIDNVNKKDD